MAGNRRPPCRAGGTMRGRIAGPCSAGHQRFVIETFPTGPDGGYELAASRLVFGLQAGFILLTTLVYLGSPDPWSAAGWQRNLAILPGERSIHAPRRVNMAYFSSCYLCIAVYVFAVR
jgi:hypothetical protein